MDIPQIDTTVIPTELLLHGPLAISVAKLDAVVQEDQGSRIHHDAVMQVIADANALNINLRVN